MWRLHRLGRVIVGVRAQDESLRGDWRAMLAARPIRNAAAVTEPSPDGGMWIVVRTASAPWRRTPWRWFVPVREHRRIWVDALGREVWELCDGEHDVESIVNEMARRYALSFHESRTAVVTWIRDLVQRGALAIALRDMPSDAGRRTRGKR